MEKCRIEIITFALMLFCQKISITNNLEMTNKNEQFNYNHSANTISHHHEINSMDVGKNEWKNPILPDGELKYLSELPLDRLLKIKKSLEEIMRISSIEEINSTYHLPKSNGNQTETDVDVMKYYDVDDVDVDGKSVAVEDRSIFDKFDKRLDVNTREQFVHGNENEKALPLINNIQIQRRTSVEPWDSKPSKIQSIFQLSVTALAFLAFAGYLLCMIVQAIKSKGTTYYHPTVTVQGNAAVKRRKPSFGRRRREVLLSADNKNDTYISIIEESMTAGPDPDQIYKVLLSMSEGFVKFQTL